MESCRNTGNKDCNTAVRPDKEEDLPKIQKDLRQFVSLIGKYAHTDYYNPIIKHSTSLQWIYIKIRQDYAIETKCVHFLNIIDLKWDPTDEQTLIGFYNSYRSMIISNLASKGDTVEWKNEVLTQDEKLNPSHEDLILLNVLNLIHNKLPAYIKDLYAHKIGNSKRLMDFKIEILSKAKLFINEIESSQAANIQCSSIQYPQYNKPKPRQQQNRFNRQPQRTTATSNRLFCRMCMLAGQPRSVYTSHLLADDNCSSISMRDRESLRQRFAQPVNSSMQEVEEIDELMEEFGYLTQEDTQHCNYIQPVPSQALTMQDSRGKNIHIELDSGATVSYAKLDAVQKHGFKIYQNSQTSRLADGKTLLPAIGEIDVTLHRNNFTVRFHAIVTKDLNFDFLGGNNFIRENQIIQDLEKKSISIHKKYSVPETNKNLILPTIQNNFLAKTNSIQSLNPGQSIQYVIPMPNETKVAVTPWFQNKTYDWPQPQICTVQQGKITIDNDLNTPINIKKHAPIVQVQTVTEEEMDQTKYEKPPITNQFKQNNASSAKIAMNTTNINNEALDIINQTNDMNKDVFNEDLTNGYNHTAGKHVARLNWANQTRPQSNKVQTISYDHNTKILLQQVIDDLTNQNVLGIPQEEDVLIQHASPSFLVRKQKAKHKK